MMKKFASLCLAFCMIFSLYVPVSAAEPDFSPVTSYIEVDGRPAIMTRQSLSNIEAAQALASARNISTEEATAIINAIEDPNITLEIRKIEVSYGLGFSLEIGCLVWVHCGGGHCNFGEIEDMWVTEAGTGLYTWNESFVHVSVTGPYDDHLRFRTSGYFEVQIEGSISGTFKAELLGIGFEVTGTIGTTLYLRKSVTVDETWP